MHFFCITASHHKDKTERNLKILIYQPIKRLLCSSYFCLPPSTNLIPCSLEESDSSIASSGNTGSTSNTADLETFEYLNNKDTGLKSLNVYPTIKNFFF